MGTYHAVDADQCRPCPRGQYQPLSGQTTCLDCQDGTSTPFVASVDISQCVGRKRTTTMFLMLKVINVDFPLKYMFKQLDSELSFAFML